MRLGVHNIMFLVISMQIFNPFQPSRPPQAVLELAIILFIVNYTKIGVSEVTKK
jgi:hypothetical protein